jgi:ketosteroid isomerase-like protein
MAPATGEADCRQTCERLSIAFANAIDRRDYPALLDLFADAAVVDRMGTIIRGRSALSAWLESRPADIVTRHVCSNIEIVQRGPETAEGLTYFTFYKAGAAADICEVDGPELVGEYHDAFVLTEQGWKIQSRKITVIFKRRTA